MRLSLRSLALLAVFAVSVAIATPESLRDLTDEDAAAWSDLNGDPLLSPDGRWLVYVWSAYDDSSGKPRQAPPKLVLRSTRDDTEHRIELGLPPGDPVNLKMSGSGRWIAVSKAGSKPGLTNVLAVQVDTGKQREFTDVRDFRFGGPAGREWLVLQSGASGGDPAFTLRLDALDSATDEREWPAVREFAVDSTGHQLAWADAKGVHTLLLGTASVRTLDDKAEAAYHLLTWSPSGRSLAVLRGDGRSRTLMTFTNGLSRKRIFDPERWNGFPQDYEIAAKANLGAYGLGYASLQWRDEDDGLFFIIQKIPPPVSPDAAGGVVLWHSRDEWLPTEKERADLMHLPEQYLAFVSPSAGRFIRLADPDLNVVFPQGRGRFALGYDWRPYGWLNRVSLTFSKSNPKDLVLIDLFTGERRVLVKGLKVYLNSRIPDVFGRLSPGRGLPEPQISPDGKRLLYMDNDGHYCVYDLIRRTSRNITQGLPVRFEREAYVRGNNEGVAELDEYSASLQAWSTDGQYVLVSAAYDVWALPLKGGQAINLTGTGRAQGIIYQDTLTFGATSSGYDLRYPFSSGDVQIVDLKKPVYFAVYDTNTGRTGIAVRMPGALRAKVLAWDDATAMYFKAKKSSTYLLLRQTSAGQDYYLLDNTWQPSRRLTDLYPQQRSFHWFAPPRYLRFSNAGGQTGKALLFTPVHAQPGRAYPTIVNVYEGASTSGTFYLSDPRNRYVVRWLREGYAVLIPDIRPRVNEAGSTAVKAVTAAVDAAVAMGIADRNRLGLHGHSYGGYETFYLVTQTDLFKAAVPIAGISNLQSWYGGLWGDAPASQFTEKQQLYMSAPWWEIPEAYRRNSPLSFASNVKTPLLISHGDADRQVPFSQSLEMFNTLRRLGNRDVVLLQYVGMDHSDDIEDLKRRELQFFDHFLKDKPAPTWWSEGVSYYQGRTPSAYP